MGRLILDIHLPLIPGRRDYGIRDNRGAVTIFKCGAIWSHVFVFDDALQKMVDLMNEIIGQRIALSKAALDPSADSNQLISQQEAILQLQEELLRVMLSCRELVLTTFSPEQWSSLAFVLEEYPNFAGLMQ